MKASWILDVALPTVIQTSGVQNLLAHNVMARTSSISIAVRCDKCSKCGKNRSKQRKQNSIKKYFLALFNAATFVTHQSRAKSLHHRQLGGKIALKACGMETKATIPLLLRISFLFCPDFSLSFFFCFFFVFWPCFALLPKAHFSLSWQFCWLVSSPAGFVCVCFPRWPITHLAKAQSRPKLAQTGR